MQAHALSFTMGDAGKLSLWVYSILTPELVYPTDLSGPLFDSITVSVERAGAVPAPSSWAMMIGRLGAIGMALRRRRAGMARLDAPMR